MTDQRLLLHIMATSGFDLDQMAQSTGIPPWTLRRVLDGMNSLNRQELSALIARFRLSVKDIDFGQAQGRDDRFVVKEVCNGYRVEDVQTGESHHLSDGVDCFLYDNPRDAGSWTVPAGTFTLLIDWQESLNADPLMTLAAYWPKQFKKEMADEE